MELRIPLKIEISYTLPQAAKVFVMLPKCKCALVVASLLREGKKTLLTREVLKGK